MHMSFWFSPDIGDFLFKGFVVQTSRAFVSICFGLGAMAVILEMLKFWRMKMKENAVAKRSAHAPSGGSETHALLSGLRLRGSIERLLQISRELLMYFSQEAINWIIMLAVMGYNGYIFLAVVAGSGLGYALFGESIARFRIQTVKTKAAMIACGDCQIKDEVDADIQTDPPMAPDNIPSISGFISSSDTHEP